MKIAYIGLGAMGAPMAANLQKAGHQLTVYNRSVAKAAPLEAGGARVASSPGAAAEDAEVVCSCVSTPDVIREVMLGEQGALLSARQGTLFVDFSTVDPETSKALSEACEARDLAFLEAPVSGGVQGASAGTLTVIVGGTEADFQRARPVFEAVGQRFTRVGEVGAASTIKLINQMLVSVNLAAVLEGLVVGTLAGVEPGVLYEILASSSGDSAALRRSVPDNILKGRFDPGFSVDLLLKDVDLALEIARQRDAPMTVAATARELYDQAREAGFGGRDITAAILPLERRHRIEVRGDGQGSATGGDRTA